MTDHEKSVAQAVHDLLLSAQPQRGDRNLAKAAELTSPEQKPARDDLRGDTFQAIQRARKAISEGASAADAERSLRDAINAALKWATAGSNS